MSRQRGGGDMRRRCATEDDDDDNDGWDRTTRAVVHDEIPYT